MNLAFHSVINASDTERRDLFLGTATQLGTTVQNIEKDFWACWTLDLLFNGLDVGSPRLLFKGGTSLSNASGLISRFSEDIDITIFREDLGQAVTVADLQALSGKKRRAQLDAIRAACQAHIAGTLAARINAVASAIVPKSQFRLELDSSDKDRQTLLFWYPSVTATISDYIRSAVKIECGAKSALDPNISATVTPYVARNVPDLNLVIENVITVKPERTFWDKVIIVHGLRQWFERRGELRHGGQRVSRHYYDIHQLMQAPLAKEWQTNHALAIDCAQHAQMFFSNTDFGLNSAIPGAYSLLPNADMRSALLKDYAAMSGMIFGEVVALDEVLASVERLERNVNGSVLMNR